MATSDAVCLLDLQVPLLAVVLGYKKDLAGVLVA